MGRTEHSPAMPTPSLLIVSAVTGVVLDVEDGSRVDGGGHDGLGRPAWWRPGHADEVVLRCAREVAAVLRDGARAGELPRLLEELCEGLEEPLVRQTATRRERCSRVGSCKAVTAVKAARCCRPRDSRCTLWIDLH